MVAVGQVSLTYNAASNVTTLLANNGEDSAFLTVHIFGRVAPEDLIL